MSAFEGIPRQEGASAKKEERVEIHKGFPEIFANPAREDVTLSYSIPFRNEWKNGNLQRCLLALLSQHIAEGESAEVQLVANLGKDISYLSEEGAEEWQKKRAAEAHVTDRETQQAVTFVKALIVAQGLASEASPDSISKLASLEAGISDPLLQKIMRQAINKANYVRLALVDATRTTLEETPYKEVGIESIRTLGADMIAQRFPENDDVVIAIWDADTVPENNKAIAQLQTLFKENPRLYYVFPAMEYLAPGTSKGVVATGPGVNVDKNFHYNSTPKHGAPQLIFRLGAYRKIQEISGMAADGFSGQEDFDTAYRLIYYFGSVQDFALLDEAMDLIKAPISLTADRTDGFMDAAYRKNQLEEGQSFRKIANDLGRISEFGNSLQEKINSLPADRRNQAEGYLKEARSSFLRRQEVQQRTNRLVMSALLHAIEEGFISVAETDELVVKDGEMLELVCGKLLTQYVRTNRELVKEFIISPRDMAAARYYLGKTSDLPETYQGPSAFQLALREYVGEVASLDVLFSSSVLEKYPEGSVKDHRLPEDRRSIMHGGIAEPMALGNTQRAFFEASEFLRSRENRMSFDGVTKSWPADSSSHVHPTRFGQLASRMQMADENIVPNDPLSWYKVPKEVVSEEGGGEQVKWYRSLNLRANGRLDLWNRMRRKG